CARSRFRAVSRARCVRWRGQPYRRRTRRQSCRRERRCAQSFRSFLAAGFGLSHQRVQLLGVEAAIGLSVDESGGAAGAIAEAVDGAQGPAAVGGLVVIVDAELLLDMRLEGTGTDRLAGLGTAEMQGVARRRRAAKIVIEGDDPVH